MEIFEYLKKIESFGFECYIVGGYVRDKLLGIDSTDIDIATSAKPKDISRIFEVNLSDNLGCTNIKSSNLNIDITTYRKESSYSKRHPKKVEYLDDILVDLERRDFTINAICLDSCGNIYDPLNGRIDLSSKLIKVIGDVEKKFRDDPLRMLRALRFSIIYNFTIEKNALDFILNNKNLLSEISYERKKIELDKIFTSGYALEGLKYLNALNMLESLGLDFKDDFREVKDLMGIWSQLDCPQYHFNKIEKFRLKNIREIVALGCIDNQTIFRYGVYDSTVAGEILGFDKNFILDIHKNMPIHNGDELKIDGEMIKELLHIESGPILKNIKETLINEILSGNLLNNVEDLSAYILKNWK